MRHTGAAPPTAMLGEAIYRLHKSGLDLDGCSKPTESENAEKLSGRSRPGCVFHESYFASRVRIAAENHERVSSSFWHICGKCVNPPAGQPTKRPSCVFCFATCFAPGDLLCRQDFPLTVGLDDHV